LASKCGQASNGGGRDWEQTGPWKEHCRYL